MEPLAVDRTNSADLHAETPRVRRLAQTGWAVAAAVVLATGAALPFTIPTAGPDIRLGLLASEQMLQGRDATLTDVLFADGNDLTRDVRRRISWWPPGVQIAVHALRRAGLDLGQALYVLAAASWVIGLAGWSLWFRTVLGRGHPLLGWVIAGFALLRMTHISSAVILGGDVIVWTIFPWVMLLQAGRGVLAATLAGLFGAWLVLAKYTGVLLVAGAGLAQLWSWRRRDVTTADVLGWIGGAAAGTGLAWLMGVGAAFQGPTPADAICRHPATAAMAWLVGGPAMSLNDSIAIVAYLMGEGNAFVIIDTTVTLLGLASAAVIGAWLAASAPAIRAIVVDASRSRRAAARLAISITAVLSIGLAALMWRGGCISWEGRHHQYGAFLLLPFIGSLAWRVFASRPGSTPARWLTIAAVLATIGTGAAYGAGAFAKRTIFELPTLAPTVAASGLRVNFAHQGAGAAAFEREFRALPHLRDAVVYTLLVDFAAAFPDLRYVYPVNDPRYRGRPAGGVVSINGHEFEQTEASLRRIFPDVPTWTHVTLESAPHLDVWIGK